MQDSRCVALAAHRRETQWPWKSCLNVLGFFVLVMGFFGRFFVLITNFTCVFSMQKLSGQTINPKLRMFGQSISGGVDMDSNGYPGVSITLAVRASGKYISRLRKQQSWLFFRLLVPAIAGGH